MSDINAILAFVAFIAVIVVWNTVLKRNIGEAMFVGFLVSCLFAGTQALSTGWASLVDGMKSDVTFAALAFVFVSALFTEMGIIGRLIDIVSSLLGRFKGGSLYAATVGSGVFGAVAHNGSAIAATIGSITIPWMKRSPFHMGAEPRVAVVNGAVAAGTCTDTRTAGSPATTLKGADSAHEGSEQPTGKQPTPSETAALVISGNAGVGAVFPFSGAFFLLLAAPVVSGMLDVNDAILPMFAVAILYVIVRVLIAWVIVRRNGIGAMDPADVRPLRRTFPAGWRSVLVLLAVAIPILATAGPTGQAVIARVGEDAADTLPILIWIPTVMLLAGILICWKDLPKGGRAWWGFMGDSAPKFGIVGMTMISAFASASLMEEMGLGDQLAPFIAMMDGVPMIITVIVVALLIAIVSGPLSTTATIAAVGTVSFLALTGAGVTPLMAYAAIIVWASAEGCTPPGAAPLYVASGIANCNPVRIFKPVIVYYLFPTLVFGALLAILPL